MPYQPGVLRVSSQGDVPVEEIIEFLGAFESAYQGVAALDSVVEMIARWDHPWHPEFGPYPTALLLMGVAPLAGRRRTGISHNFGRVPRAAAPLVLRSVRLESPGEWVFSGAGKILDVIRQYLVDRHERRKDKEYREPAERERLRLENQILENEAFAGRIRNLRELGMTPEDLRPFVRDVVVRPLRSLGRQQDRGMIQGVDGTERDMSEE